MQKSNILALSLLALHLIVTPAHAALFDDNEARKKILEVEAKSLANDELQQAAINELKKKLSALEGLQSQNVHDLQSQLEQLKQELATVKGDLEVANHNLEQAQQRQKELYSDTDGRLRKLEEAAVKAENTVINPPVPSPTPATVIPVADEKDAKAYSDANELSKSLKHKEAFSAFDSFLKDFPNSKLVPDALYNLGYEQFALKNYKSSIVTQQKLIDLHPDSLKVPDAMYNMANSQIQLGQVTNAKLTLKDLIAKYPNAEVTPNAQKRLKLIESIK